jgi:hypothetical protein
MFEVTQKLQAAELAKAKGYEEALRLLEEAHLLAQSKSWPHFYVHWKMFLLALEFKVWKEAIGQIPRLLLAVPGSALGRAPRGNVGSTKMGIFEEKKP